MNLKHLLVSSILAGASFAAFAEGEWLHVKTEKGWEVFSLENVDRLVFSDKVMTASDKSGNVKATFNRSDLTTMYVDNEESSKGSSGINGVVTENAKATFSFDSSTKNVIMNADGVFSIYGTDGSLLLSIPEAKAGEIINISRIGARVVILQSNGFTLKALLK